MSRREPEHIYFTVMVFEENEGSDSFRNGEGEPKDEGFGLEVP